MQPLRALFIVVVIDVLGFGIMVPLLPYMAESFGAEPMQLTMLLGVYSFCQLVASPVLGRLSDRYGRRPILLIGLAGNCVSYLMLGFAGNLWWLLVARVLGGIMAGNLAAAFAYAADVSQPEHRAKALGVVGAAVGVGFLLGPAIGGLLAGEDLANINFLRPALASMLATFVAMALVWRVLPESHAPDQRRAAAGASGHAPTWRLLRTLPALRWLALATLAVTVAQSVFESIYALWALQRFNVGPRTTGLSMLALASMAILAQAVLVRLWIARFGEYKLIWLGLACFFVSMLMLASALSFASTLLGLALLGLGIGLYNPNGSSLASRQAVVSNRGAVMGVYTASGALGRVIGPMSSGAIYSAAGPAMPYVAAAGMVLLAVWAIAISKQAAGELGVS
jgi:MFS transporter, DHA1 family, tetracycline resistance protein